MSDGEGAFLFCAPGSESSSHERRRAVLCRKQNGDPLFLPPTNSLTPRSFSFLRCWRIPTPRASPWLSTPYRETPPCPGRACGGGHSGGLPLAIGDTGAVLTGEGCSDVAFPRDIGSPILTKYFTRRSNSPTCQVTGRKVRSWNVIVLFSHCPTPPDVFMILRKLPRHKDAIYDRQKTIRLRPCEPESYCLPLRMSLSVF